MVVLLVVIAALAGMRPGDRQNRASWDRRPPDSTGCSFPAGLAYPGDVNLNRVAVSGGEVWLHITRDAGQYLVRYDTVSGSARSRRISKNPDSAFSGGLAVDESSGRVWVAWRDIIGFWDPATGSWQQTRRAYPLGSSVGPLGLTLDGEGRAWVVWTDVYGSVFSYGPDLRETRYPILPETIPANSVTQLAIQERSLWIACARGLVARVNLDSMEVATFRFPADALAIAPEGRVYGVGRMGDPVFVKLDPDGTVDDLLTSLGLEPDEPPRGLALRPDGRLWVVTPRGAILYDPMSGSRRTLGFPLRQVSEEGASVPYGSAVSQGLFWAPVIFLNLAVDGNGDLWFADRAWYHCVWQVCGKD